MKLFWKIVKESLKVLIITSLISSIGGIGLESVNEQLVALLPILILLPALNNMIGSFGTVISARISTLLYMGKINEKGLWKSHSAGNLFVKIAVIAFVSSIYISLLASAVAIVKGFDMNALFVIKLMIVTIMITSLLIVLMFWISVTAGFYVFKKNKDPDNFLIPLTTSIADLGTMLLMSGVVIWLF
ncbi:magnesium transporter [candidate division KSB1 bacterium]